MKKNFFIMLGLFSFVVLGLNIYLYSQMLDHTNPLRVEEQLEFWFQIERIGLPFLFLGLLIQSNRISREFRSGNYFMLSALFFVVLTLLDYVFMAEVYFHFRQDTGLWQGEFSVLGFVGFFFSFIAVLVSWLNYFIANYKGRSRKNAQYSNS